MNIVVLCGRLTRDPDCRFTQSGKQVTSFTLAVDKYVKAGEQKQADFIPVVLWGKTAEVAGNGLSKGSKIVVSGRLQVRSYENNEGKKVWVTEVIGERFEFADSRNSGGGQHAPDDAGVFGSEVGQDDDLPF